MHQNDLLHFYEKRNTNVPALFMEFNGKSSSSPERETLGWEIHKSIAPLAYDTVLKKSSRFIS